ncbi:methylenetetrahydrofolate reductase [Limibacillus halophilus]|uniref:Methylenetetrahydrofolate reductase n=1 Tax=Limibacillus halophilus TaxID=1579333 RepID=A0A839SRP9_9PROT|nr:methylenetetrahydrofolate reductase [Limibacillus halophilus]MBB3064390.1 methylenetetrahydrofolate reductase (NADPH) [Limibacillus halophilus]
MSLEKTIADFLTDFTIETTPGSAAKIPDYREHLREGTKVAVTFLPGSDFADTVKTSKKLKDEGMVPMPHFAARSIPSKDAFADYLKRLQDDVGIAHVVALAGAVEKPLGPYESSMALLETGLFEEHGIQTIGIAGHPEGSPDISDSDLASALAWKNTYARSSSAKLYIVTQFCFEAEPILAWEKRIRNAGNALPIHIGLPGLATIKTLVNHARACGIGPSMNFLVRQARNVAKLMTVNAPDKLTLDLAQHVASNPECLINKVHMYPLGGLRKSAAWSYAVVEGDITLKSGNKGFKVNRDID